MNEIDDAIGKVEILYRTLTGRDVPPVEVPYAPIPAEREPAQHVQEQMDRLMRMLVGTPPQPAAAAPTAWTPVMSAWQGDTELVFCVDVPGVRREHLDVSVQGPVVVISGQRVPPPDSSSEAARLRPRGAEQTFGPFRRAIPLPPGVQSDQLAASLRDGVLWLRIPSETSPQARSVSVS